MVQQVDLLHTSRGPGSNLRFGYVYVLPVGFLPPPKNKPVSRLATINSVCVSVSVHSVLHWTDIPARVHPQLVSSALWIHYDLDQNKAVTDDE